MYLAEKARKVELTNLKKRNCNYNYKNKKNESVLSLVLKNMYSTIGQSTLYLPYIKILTSYIHFGHNFDIPIDEDENTPIMLLIIVNDIHTLNYVLNYSNNYNLSLKNKYGESACSLALKYKLPKGILTQMIKHPTFDINYKDLHNGNNILMLSSMTEPMMINNILEINNTLINTVNNNNENALILATKSNCKGAITPLLNHHININHQDYLGNTALFYAIDKNNVELIKLLVSGNANMNLKNIEGVSPLDYAKKLNYKYILNIMMDSYSSIDNESFENKEVKDYYFQFNQGNDSVFKYNEINDYLYPNIGKNKYSEIDLPFDLIIAERKVYLELMNNVDMKPYQSHDSSTSSYDMNYIKDNNVISVN